MKKKYVLLSGMVLASSLGFSQSILNSDIKPLEMQARPTSVDANAGETDLYKKNQFNSKVYGDTLFYEDFDGGIPSGWSVTNNNSTNNLIWKWDTVYQQGNFSLNTTAIKSTTASNGFMSLPCDFYNTNAAVAMDTYFESGSITNSKGGNFPDAVFVTYQQYLRYCCNSSNRLVLQVSTDNFATNTEFDATAALAVNAANSTNANGGAINVINITCAAGGASSFKIRFLSEGNSHYFWMIDDFAVIEGPANDLALEDAYMEFNVDNYGINPFYGQIPYELFPDLPFSGNIINNGSATQTGVDLNVSVDHLSAPGGGTGQGNVYSTSEPASSNGSILGPLCDSVVSVLTGTPRFIPSILGSFEVEFNVTGDSVDQITGNATATRTFDITDTIYARDDNNYGGGTGPGSYVDNATRTPGGQTAGDRFAVLYVIESKSGNGTANIPTSVTFGVSANAKNIGVEIQPKIWEFHEDSSTLNTAIGPEVANAPFNTYVITSSDTNTLLTLPFVNGSATNSGLDSGQYAVGWEVVTLPPATTPPADPLPSFEVYNDASSAATQAPVSAFVYLAHAPTAGWGPVAVNPVIRLNMGGLKKGPVGLEDNNASSAQFEVSPNPSNGQLKLNISTEQNTSYNLNVRNILGQVVYTSTLRVNGSKIENLDLSDLEKGVYFVSLENENEKLLKKVVLK